MFRHFSPDEIVSRLNNLIERLPGNDWILAYTGGEPFCEPEFVDLCIKSSANHKLIVQTNLLSTSEIKFFSETVPKDSIINIAASYHHEVLKEKKLYKTFVANLELLIYKGFKVFINIMCSSKNIDEILEKAEEFKQKGARIALRKIFRIDRSIIYRFVENIRLYQHKEKIDKLQQLFWAKESFFIEPNLLKGINLPRGVCIDIDFHGNIRYFCGTYIKTKYNLFKDVKGVENMNLGQKSECTKLCLCPVCLWVFEDWGFC